MRLRRARGKWTCSIKYTDKFGRPCEGKGRTFVIDFGKGDVRETDAFPVGVLCGMLCRSYRCIDKWEKEHGFPKALYNFEDDKVKKRWYSRAQLVTTLSLYTKFGRLDGANRSKLKEFIKLVDAVWLVQEGPSCSKARKLSY